MSRGRPERASLLDGRRSGCELPQREEVERVVQYRLHELRGGRGAKVDSSVRNWTERTSA